MAFIIFFLKKFEKFEKTVFLGLILRFSNLNVLHKGLLLQDWVFGLGVQVVLNRGLGLNKTSSVFFISNTVRPCDARFRGNGKSSKFVQLELLNNAKPSSENRAA